MNNTVIRTKALLNIYKTIPGTKSLNENDPRVINGIAYNDIYSNSQGNFNKPVYNLNIRQVCDVLLLMWLDGVHDGYVQISFKDWLNTQNKPGGFLNGRLPPTEITEIVDLAKRLDTHYFGKKIGIPEELKNKIKKAISDENPNFPSSWERDFKEALQKKYAGNKSLNGMSGGKKIVRSSGNTNRSIVMFNDQEFASNEERVLTTQAGGFNNAEKISLQKTQNIEATEGDNAHGLADPTGNIETKPVQIGLTFGGALDPGRTMLPFGVSNDLARIKKLNSNSKNLSENRSRLKMSKKYLLGPIDIEIFLNGRSIIHIYSEINSENVLIVYFNGAELKPKRDLPMSAGAAKKNGITWNEKTHKFLGDAIQYLTLMCYGDSIKTQLGKEYHLYYASGDSMSLVGCDLFTDLTENKNPRFIIDFSEFFKGKFIVVGKIPGFTLESVGTAGQNASVARDALSGRGLPTNNSVGMGEKEVQSGGNKNAKNLAKIWANTPKTIKTLKAIKAIKNNMENPNIKINSKFTQLTAAISKSLASKQLGDDKRQILTKLSQQLTNLRPPPNQGIASGSTLRLNNQGTASGSTLRLNNQGTASGSTLRLNNQGTASGSTLVMSEIGNSGNDGVGASANSGKNPKNNTKKRALLKSIKPNVNNNSLNVISILKLIPSNTLINYFGTNDFQNINRGLNELSNNILNQATSDILSGEGNMNIRQKLLFGNMKHSGESNGLNYTKANFMRVYNMLPNNVKTTIKIKAGTNNIASLIRNKEDSFLGNLSRVMYKHRAGSNQKNTTPTWFGNSIVKSLKLGRVSSLGLQQRINNSPSFILEPPVSTLRGNLNATGNERQVAVGNNNQPGEKRFSGYPESKFQRGSMVARENPNEGELNSKLKPDPKK